MSVKILSNNKTSPNIGNLQVMPDGRVMHYGVAQWNGTDLTGFLPTGGLKWLQYVAPFTPIGQVASSGFFDFQAVEFAAIAATTVFELPPAPVAGVVSLANFTVSTTIGTAAANIWTFGIVNKTQTKTVVDSTNPLNSNNSSGGIAFTSYAATTLTLNSAANLVIAVNDVLEVTVTKASSAANLTEFAFNLGMTTNSIVATERIELNEAATVDTTYGTFKVNQNSGIYSIAVSRPSTPTPTSGLNFYYMMIGQN